jgi:hypothetical protein
MSWQRPARRVGFQTAAILLEGSLKAQRQFSQFTRRLARKVKEDGNPHSSTHILTDTGGSPFVLIWACWRSEESLDAAGKRLEDYLSAKKHQVGALRAALMLFDSRGATLLKLLFDNRDVGPDPDLDLAASTLFPLDFTAPPVPPRARRKRNSKKRRR